MHQVDKVAQKCFADAHPPTPTQFPQVVKVGVADVGKDLIKHAATCGGLPRLSPEEPLQAIVKCIHEAIERNTNDDELLAWRGCLLNTSLEFVVCKTDEGRMWQRINTREAFTTEHELFSRSSVTRIFEVLDVAKRLQRPGGGPAGAGQVAEAWKEHVQTSGLSESINFTYVDTAMTVHKRVLLDSDAMAAIM